MLSIEVVHNGFAVGRNGAVLPIPFRADALGLDRLVDWRDWISQHPIEAEPANSAYEYYYK